eukprot:TRINITY_DN14_c0_g1::TRINITY_DN14_c0_g1_i1::g.14757::m.14757 TRINITY_DN14_c0_g1::TRINITY_DN14_c0_g1_i1::g.14757  ORF type:complete len:253 (-),score=120.53,sp/Q01105/SET_HUMAN/43.08/2e-43,NAP/PF00956.13/1.2e-47,Phage_Mu_Gam/PF07352.7/0.00041,DUF4252/PF14060.1/0.24,DUF4252/PF14060.1/4.8e+03 TRINITY_DN14_c0_g1_i1:172-888(-)
MASKKQKFDEGSDEALQEALEQLENIQVEAEKIEEKKQKEFTAIERKYYKLLAPVFQKRKAVVAKIPNFWLTVLLNHPITQAIINQEDQDALRYLDDIEVQVADNVEDESYKLILRFRENPYFTDKELIKEFVFEGDDLTQKAFKISWKAGKDLTSQGKDEKKDEKKRQHDEDSMSFFDWFTQDASEEGVELGEYFRAEIYLNPIKIYQGVPDEDDLLEMDDDDEGDEGDGSDEVDED